MFRAVGDRASLVGANDGNEQIRTVRTALATSTVDSRPSELLQRLADPEFDPYRIAYNEGMNVSTLLEVLDPSQEHENSQLDAFERIIRASGVRLQSDHVRGIFAHRLEDLETNLSTKRLIPELISRMYRGAIHGGNGGEQRAQPVFLSSDYATGTQMRPWAQRPTPFIQPIQAALPVSLLVAVTTGITGDAYRGFYIDQDPEAVRLKRVTEATELPRTKIKGRAQTVNLYKYGRAIEMSYETLRRMSIDMVSILIQMMAAQSEADKLGEAIDVLVNGDGNNNAITTFNLTTLDPSATAGRLSLSGYTGFQLEFETPYTLTVMIAQKGVTKQVLLLNTGSANIPLATYAAVVGFGGVRPLNRTQDNIGLGWTSGAPANIILGIDTSKALERVYEIGASISETDRFIERQTEILTLSETEGWGLIDPNARKALDVSQ